jgi:putative ABC transport system permease protein
VIQVPLVGLESSGRLRAAEVVDGEGRLDPTLPFALVGPRAAEVLGIDAYPAIVYVADTPFVVTGEVAGDPLISELRRGLIVSATYAQDHFEGLATTLYVRTARSVSFDEVAAAANPAAPSGISVQRPRQLIEARSRADQSLGALTNVVLVSAYVAAGLVLTLTLVSSIRQRTAEFGIRRCLGATGGQVVLLAGGEAIFIGLIGSIIGVSAGLAAALGWALHNSWPYEVSATQLVSALAFSGLVSAFAAMPPALVASRLDPVQAVTTDV